MICKYCNKKLKKADVQVCPHCKNKLSPQHEGNGFYDILSSGAVKNEAVSEVDTKETPKNEKGVLYILTGCTCVAAVITVCVFILMAIKINGYKNELHELREFKQQVENERLLEEVFDEENNIDVTQ